MQTNNLESRISRPSQKIILGSFNVAVITESLIFTNILFYRKIRLCHFGVICPGRYIRYIFDGASEGDCLKWMSAPVAIIYLAFEISYFRHNAFM